MAAQHDQQVGGPGPETQWDSGGGDRPLSRRTREVVLPRFKLERNYDLIENLKEMGLTDLFKQSGDFSGMTSEKVLINWVRRPPSGRKWFVLIVTARLFSF